MKRNATAGKASKPATGKSSNQLSKSGTIHSIDDTNGESSHRPAVESDLMGANSKDSEGDKSEVMDKNLIQMFDVLRKRLDTLKEAASTRSKLCEEDTNKNSDRMSEQAPKIIDEFDEVVPRSLRDIKMPTLSHKDNLVSSDTIYIDPYHLVFSKTKVPTEAAKNLEATLEESFGNINLREMKSKKSKTLNQTEKSKKSEQLKNEAKRINRMKIEKKLQQNMESFVTRSVMDSELRFDAPPMVNIEADWPVTIKWCAKDPRSVLPENNEGEFDPDLLLRYSIERINLPSGKKLFNFLVRQPMLQRYFVSLFWLLKVKFFETENVEESECYLMRLLSIDYRRIVELLASRAHAEHEKDFTFRFIPFVLANGVYFGFYYVFPGSRHIYTKGFKKTIYMQIVQIMHGIQLCPSSVKVAWSKLFPEDAHEDGDEVEDGGESFPVLIALRGSAGVGKSHGIAMAAAETVDDDSVASSATGNRSRSLSHDFAETGREDREGDASAGNENTAHQRDGHPPHQNDALSFADEKFHRPNLARGHVKGGFLSDQAPQYGGDHQHHHANFSGHGHGHGHTSIHNNYGQSIEAAYKILQNQNQTSKSVPPVSAGGLSASAQALQSDTLINALQRRNSSAKLEKSVQLTANSLATMALNPKQTRKLSASKSMGSALMSSSSPHTRASSPSPSAAAGDRPDTSNSSNPGATNDSLRSQHRHTVQSLVSNATMQSTLGRTHLKPLRERPHRQKTLVVRQNVFERLNAHEQSPQMQLYLSDAAGAQPQAHSHIQAFQRTIPINWCATGGSDTHHKLTIATELHSEISSKLRKSEHELAQSKTDYHKEKIRSVLDTKAALSKVMGSGPTNISRFSLDLIRRQRSKVGGASTGNKNEAPDPAIEDVASAESAQQLIFYSDDELAKILDEI
mmetsp:Transcript_8566/g.14232  ORF Transcript_8566/g.14232 Transcript_8566/m.14232 type:complete len:912 (-) Transcript_8566:200-2935(-)|eukprot:CAMPEP_0174962216 /NCGR_PEP_ID=MMETSP0004_2-20121128/4664_1 /TAXON_ID=420556 /ORGANISM="Ochromonas sp., Strain CCMP1393" /LENGTH=911 /DNA_ID=CAMNT_0016210731 /DNA_START=28 /DNA_END=2763 /DNA_ORIENTATION=-